MKGVKAIKLDGKEVKLRFTVGTLEDFQDYLDGVNEKRKKDDKDPLGVDQAMGQMKHLRELLSIMSEYAGSKIEADKFKLLEFSEMTGAINLITDATKNLPKVGNPMPPAKAK